MAKHLTTKRLQFILWPTWRGVRWHRWHRWQGGISRIYRGSLLIGWLEVRVWR